MARLISQSGHSFDLPPFGLTFGSDSSNDVVIPDQFGVAPCHFAIWPDGDSYTVRDSGSGFGLFVNGRQVQETRLQHGDAIAASGLHLTYSMPVAALASVAPAEPMGISHADRRHNAFDPCELRETAGRSAPVGPTSAVAPPLPAERDVPAEFPDRTSAFSGLAATLAPPRFAPLSPAQPQPQPTPGPELPNRMASFSDLMADLGLGPAPDAHPTTASSRLAEVLENVGPVEATGSLRPPAISVASALTPASRASESNMPEIAEVLSPKPSIPSLAEVVPTPTFQIERKPADLPTAPESAAAPAQSKSPTPVLQPFALPALRLPEPDRNAAVEPKNRPPEKSPEAAPAAPTVEFEILPASSDRQEANRSLELMPSIKIERETPKAEPPPWLMTEEPSPVEAATPETSRANEGGKISRFHRRDVHSRPIRWSQVFFAVTLITFVLAACTLNRWCPDFAVKAKDYLTSVFTERSKIDSPAKGEGGAEGDAKVKLPDPTPIRIDTTKPHEELAMRFLWPEATTMFSLGFPQAELLYVAAAHARNLPMPSSHCAYIEKHFGLKIQDLDRLTCIQAEPEKPGIVIVTIHQQIDPASLLQYSSLRASSVERVGDSQFYLYDNRQAVPCGLTALDDRTLVIGDPALMRGCMQRKSPSPGILSALWPDFARKSMGAFLWTVKVDSALQSQLATSAGNKTPLDLSSVQSFAVRYGSEQNECECFALRNEKASHEVFATAASNCLKSMLAMLSTQIEARLQHGAVTREAPAVNVSRNVASAVLKRGEEFVNLFLEGFYAPIASEQSPLEPLAKARTLAHSFNLARGLGAPEAQKVRSVEEALDALQRGMTGTGRGAGMEFHVQTMEPDELRTIRSYLTFGDGYLACRPNLEGIPEAIRGLIREGADRLNAETVISLCVPPSSDKVVRIKDLGAFIKLSLTKLKAGRGAMALFGMPQLTDDEIAGVLKYIHQDNTGKLSWKPGELAYSEWQAKADPAALHDATTLASMSGAAKAAGCANLAKAKSVEEAISMLVQGVKGGGQFSTTTFRCKELNNEQVRAAATFLELNNGALKLKAE